MNTRIALVMAAALGMAVGGAGMLMAQKGDRETVDNTVGSMSEQELTPVVQPNNPSNPPVLTPQQVRQIVGALRDPEAHNGLLGIAHEFGCSLGQVKMIKAARDRRLRELHPAEPEPGEIE